MCKYQTLTHEYQTLVRQYQTLTHEYQTLICEYQTLKREYQNLVSHKKEIMASPYLYLTGKVSVSIAYNVSMPRPKRNLQPGFCYHITTRCNNREFRLTRLECREVMLYAIKKAQQKYGFKLYALCIMSNHVHYLLEPKQPEELPKIMHWLNWYTAMCFNRMLNRTGHFWEKRYHSTGFANTDKRRALNTLRYIHANPKAAQMQQGFFYDFSNYGIHDRLSDDGITQWHPAFLQLGRNLEECAAKYRGFCKKYRPQPKPEKRNHWGSRFLPPMRKGSKSKKSPGQMSLPWDKQRVTECTEVHEVAEKFIRANGFFASVPGNEILKC